MLHVLRVEMVINSPWMLSKNWLIQKQTAFELASLKANGYWANDNCFGTLLLLNAQVTSLGIVCLPNEEIFASLAQMGYEKPSTKLTFYEAFFSSQWKFLIHTILQSLSAKRTSWNEFSTAMASAVICLSKGQRFNFSKYIFDSLVRNVDSSSKFYMYPRFIQLIIQNQVGNLSTHTTRFISPALTQKVFANIRRAGKGFSGVETPLFEGMLAVRQPAKEEVAEVQVQVDVVVAVEENIAEDVAHDAIPSPPPHRVENLKNDNASQKLVIVKLQARVKKLEKANKIKSSKLRHLRKVGASTRVEYSDDIEDVFNQGRMIDDMGMDEGIELVKDVKVAKSEGRHAAKQAEKQAEIYNLDLDHSLKVLSIQEDDSEVQEVVKVVTTAKLITKVVTAAASQVSAASTTIPAASATIPAAKPSILVAALTVVAAYTRRRKGVIIRDPEEELSSKTPAETPKPMKKKDQIEIDAKYARKLHEEINRDEFNKDIDWDAAMDHVNQKSNNPQYIKRYQGIKKRPQTESEARKNMMIYLKNTAGYKMDFFKGMTYAQICLIFQARFDENMRFLFKSSEEMEEEDQKIIKSINETPAQKAAKRKKLSEEAQEAEDLRKRLEVVEDEDDDVFVEATPLASKNQVRDLSTHTTRFISPALTQKVFANMRRVGKGFSGVDDAVAAAIEENVAEDVSHDAIPSPPPHAISSPSQEPSSPPQQQQRSPQAPPQDAEFPTQLQQVLNVCSALTKCVENLENDNAAQKLVIIKLKARVNRKVGTSRRVESSDDMDDVFNQGRMIDDMDMDEGIELVKDADIAESEGRNAAEHAEKRAEIYNLDLDHSLKVLSMQEDDSEVQEVVEVVTTAKLITEIVTAATSQPSIPAAAPTVVAAYTRRRKRVIIRDPEEELPLKTLDETPKVTDKGKGILVETPKPMKKKDQIELDAEYARKLHEEINRDEFNKDTDWDAAMDHVNQKSNKPQYIKRYKGMKKRHQTESEARKNMMIYLKNTAGYKMDFFKGMTYAQICPIFQARFDENMRFLFKSREEMEEEDQEIIKSINETHAQKAAKRRKLSEEAQEAKDLRKRLEVVEDEDDDVFVEATPLAQKVPVVDYQIVLVDNKPRFKIIRADETHQFYISFTTLLKNFDKEDLESLWRIVKDIFSTSKPTNFSDEYLLLTLKTMFEEPDGQDAIWGNQKSVHGLALVKRWKLLTSCGVYVITLSTVQPFLLVEKRYPLSRFTLKQLVNVTRLQVEEENEMFLELLRFTRQQLQEYQQR
uniref:Glutamic acid-rich protein-like n=1 Tax=Tanacetum cinerariifolium TaxID=118510 RepID=A0A6L2J2G0_TANCI|nr:hypothetical protein [Tanacetum cinerariifolium]